MSIQHNVTLMERCYGKVSGNFYESQKVLCLMKMLNVSVILSRLRIRILPKWACNTLQHYCRGCTVKYQQIYQSSGGESTVCSNVDFCSNFD